MKQQILFSKTFNVADKYYPQPSYKFLPEWYKKTDSYEGNKKGITFQNTTNGTIKQCQPVFDALTAGYIIPTYTDIMVKKTEDGTTIYIPSASINNNSNPIQHHPIIQAPYHPYMNHHPYPKWINPWSIKTPKGYSCLFIPPVHGGNEYFTVMEGFADTDQYYAPINFPFVLKDVDFEGIIPAGTPIVQVIPIKRDSWKLEYGNEKDVENSNNIAHLLSTKFFHRYKTMFWNKKEYK